MLVTAFGHCQGVFNLHGAQSDLFVKDLILALCTQELLRRRRQFTDHETHLGMFGFEVGLEGEAGKRFAAHRADGNQ